MKTTVRKTLSLVISFALLCTVMAISFPLTTSAANTSYYVDATSGNDNNDGKSTGAAWKTLTKVNATTFGAGDKILLKRGCSWTGTLYPKGSGAIGNPITIDAYGTGNLPIINGNGKYYTDADPIDAAVYFKNQSYITIKNLEITNNASTAADRQGIHFDGSGTNSKGIRVQNCKIHDVKSNGNHGEHGRMAAILVFARNWWTAYSDVVIENNEIYNVGSTGIHVNAQDQAGPGTGIVIQNNYLHEIGGDGIMVLSATSPVVQYNVVNGAHYTSTQYCCGIWPFDCNDALIQFNEVYNTKTTIDGQGFDSDYQCRRSVFQYNYAHNNEGGFFLICCEPTTWDGGVSWNDGTIIRYNIGENNLNSQFAFSSKVTNTYIYNNTIYYSGTSKTVTHYSRDGISYPDETHFWNNIFYNQSSNGSYSLGNSTNTEWDYNLFYGNHHSTEPADAHKLTSDPKFVSPGNAGLGLDSCSVYQLQSGSPALNSGKVISNNGGRDYFGNTVSSTAAPNRGAYNGAGGGSTTTTTTTASTTTTAPPSGSEVLIYNFSTSKPTTYGWTYGTTPTFETVPGYESMGNLMVGYVKQDQWLYFDLPSGWNNLNGNGAPEYVSFKMRLNYADNSVNRSFSFAPTGGHLIEFTTGGYTAGTNTLTSNITVKNNEWTEVRIPVTSAVLSTSMIRMRQGWLSTLPTHWYIDDVKLVYSGSVTTTAATTTQPSSGMMWDNYEGAAPGVSIWGAAGGNPETDPKIITKATVGIASVSGYYAGGSKSLKIDPGQNTYLPSDYRDMQARISNSTYFSGSATGIKFWARSVGSNITVHIDVGGNAGYRKSNVTITTTGGWITIPYSEFGSLTGATASQQKMLAFITSYHSNTPVYYIDEVQCY